MFGVGFGSGVAVGSGVGVDVGAGVEVGSAVGAGAGSGAAPQPHSAKRVSARSRARHFFIVIDLLVRKNLTDLLYSFLRKVAIAAYCVPVFLTVNHRLIAGEAGTWYASANRNLLPRGGPPRAKGVIHASQTHRR